jgi:hypothetical protein
MRIVHIIAGLVLVLMGCQDAAVRGPQEWQDIAQREMTERLQSAYDTVFEDVGFIKATVGGRMDVYDVVNGKVEHFFTHEQGETQGYEFEWSPDGSLWSVSHFVNGDMEGTAVEFNYDRGKQYIREYRQGVIITTDSIPLVDRPLIPLFTPPPVSGSAD